MPNRKLINGDELCEWLYMTKGYMYRLIWGNRIPYKRVGKYFRFDRREIEEWISGENAAKEAFFKRKRGCHNRDNSKVK